MNRPIPPHDPFSEARRYAELVAAAALLDLLSGGAVSRALDERFSRSVGIVRVNVVPPVLPPVDCGRCLACDRRRNRTAYPLPVYRARRVCTCAWDQALKVRPSCPVHATGGTPWS